MSDLTIEELDSVVTSLGGHAIIDTSMSETARMVAELRRYRSAKDANEERIREVVRYACLCVERTAVTAVAVEKLDAIINRAVEQLATPSSMLGSDDVRIVKKVRAEIEEYGMSDDPSDDIPRLRNKALAVLDRILAAHGIKP